MLLYSIQVFYFLFLFFLYLYLVFYFCFWAFQSKLAFGPKYPKSKLAHFPCHGPFGLTTTLKPMDLAGPTPCPYVPSPFLHLLDWSAYFFHPMSGTAFRRTITYLLQRLTTLPSPFNVYLDVHSTKGKKGQQLGQGNAKDRERPRWRKLCLNHFASKKNITLLNKPNPLCAQAFSKNKTS